MIQNPFDEVEIKLPLHTVTLSDVLESVEKRYIQKALIEAGGSPTKAAKALQTKRTTLIEKIKKHGLRGVGKALNAA